VPYELWIGTIMPVLVSVLVLWVIRRTTSGHLSRPISSFLFLYGVWAFGLPVLMVGAPLLAGSQVEKDTLWFAVKGMFAYPYATWIAAAYGGPLGALIVITPALIGMGVIQIARSRRMGTHNQAL
jgi:hypothetical protein